MQGDGVVRHEAETVVERDRAGVGGDDVQPGGLVFAALHVDEVREKSGGEALAAVSGMRAEAADLGKAGEAKAFAAHGDEAAVMIVDAEVGAHETGAWAEEAGEGYVGQRDHRGGVRGGEARDGFAGGGHDSGRDRGCGEHHLQAGEALDELQGRAGRGVIGDPDKLSGREQRSELAERVGGGGGDCGEGSHVGGVACGIAGAQGEMRVLGSERVPDGVRREMLRELRHTLISVP